MSAWFLDSELSTCLNCYLLLVYCTTAHIKVWYACAMHTFVAEVLHLKRPFPLT